MSEKRAPMPNVDDLEAALRREYGGTPTTDALIDVVMPVLRSTLSTQQPSSIYDFEEGGPPTTVDDTSQPGNDLAQARYETAMKCARECDDSTEAGQFYAARLYAYANTLKVDK